MPEKLKMFLTVSVIQIPDEDLNALLGDLAELLNDETFGKCGPEKRDECILKLCEIIYREMVSRLYVIFISKFFVY